MTRIMIDSCATYVIASEAKQSPTLSIEIAPSLHCNGAISCFFSKHFWLRVQAAPSSS